MNDDEAPPVWEPIAALKIGFLPWGGDGGEETETERPPQVTTNFIASVLKSQAGVQRSLGGQQATLGPNYCYSARSSWGFP